MSGLKLIATPIDAVWVVQSERIYDERGAFMRAYDHDVFVAHGLDARVAQCSVSQNTKRGTLRGMHYQVAPHEEAKLVRCVRGRVFDVGIDLRPWSKTYCRSFGLELAGDSNVALYLGPGIAHGFMTLSDDAELFYQISVAYAPSAARGVRWDDALFKIAWPMAPSVIAERDENYPDYVPKPSR